MEEINVFFINIFNDIKDSYLDLDSTEKILFYSIIGLLVLVILLLSLLLRKKKPKKIKEKKIKEKRKNETLLLEEAFSDKEEDINIDQDKNINIEKPEKAIDNKRIDLEKIKQQLEEDAKNKNIDLTHYEKDQEENAIISYEELKKAAAKEDKQLDFDDVVEQIQARNEVVEEKKIPYKPTPFISPIFGIEKPNIEIKEEPIVQRPKSLEETLSIEPISKEIKKNDEFLEALKDFRKNLD